MTGVAGPRDAAEVLAEELADEMSWSTVCGVWPETRERFKQWYPTDSARSAEDMAQQDARRAGGELWVTGVFPGRLYHSDDYATFVDPDVQP